MHIAALLALFAIGVVASIFGSLVGLGGGFVIIPVLRIAFGIPPAEVAGTSLLLVFANTASSTFGFLRAGMLRVGLAGPYAIGAVPGSIIGVEAVKRISAVTFDVAYGGVLLTLAILALRRRHVASRPEGERTFADDWRVGIAAGLVLGVFSSAFGIGGGVVMIPLLLIAARLPPHVVAATSAFVVTLTAPIGIIVHAVAHDVDWALTIPLIAGGVVGGGIAPEIARRVSSPRLITLLAIALILAAAGLILRHVI
ncbi:MAG: sulfite exporter TauE/SafE family protein [Candidatus Elarobacter sp.]